MVPVSIATMLPSPVALPAGSCATCRNSPVTTVSVRPDRTTRPSPRNHGPRAGACYAWLAIRHPVLGLRQTIQEPDPLIGDAVLSAKEHQLIACVR